ncbi:MAG: PAS domain-containing protein, partial [Rhodospirillales bacterium]|nr:PAS domain-containing protein [Rhodospirillales bacterium]
MSGRKSPGPWLTAAFAVNISAVIAAYTFLPDSYAEKQAYTGLMIVAVTMAAMTTFAAHRIIELVVMKQAKTLAAAARAIAHGDRPQLEVKKYAALLPLAEAVDGLGTKLAELRRDFHESVATAARRAEEEKGRLGAILNDLHQGIVVCNMQHQVVLYNQVALDHLHVSGEMGLGRSLFGVVSREPVQHTLEVLMRRSGGGRRSAPFLSGTTDGRSLLHGRLSLVEAHGDVTGYVLAF